MSKFSLLVILMLAISVLTDEKVGVIVDNFNKKNWTAIYEQFSVDLKHTITEKQFKTSMDSVRNTLGIMQDYVQITEGQLYFICETRLDTGVAIYKVNEQNQFTSFFLSYSPKSTFTYLHENRNNSKVSLSFSTIKHNYSLNSKSPLAICSVFKITLVAEYARQVSQNKIDPQLCVDLSKLNQYFMPHVDNGHTSWLQTITKTCATHEQIVVGMIKYSSNANAQYLIDLLTPQSIDELTSDLQLNHSNTLYVVSSMFAMNNTYNLPRQQYLNTLRLITPDELRNISLTIHSKLKKNQINLSKDQFYLDADVIDIHVELIARSNTESYLKFMQIINNNEYFNNQTLDTIKTLFDQVDMVSDFARQTFEHAGAKGGSANLPGMKNTALAVAGYAQITNQIKVSYSLILNHMNSDIFAERLIDLNNFILAIETSEFYVSEFIKRMNKKSIEDPNLLREISE